MSITNLTDQFAQDLRQTISICQKLLAFYDKIGTSITGPFSNTELEASLLSKGASKGNLQSEIDSGVAELQTYVAGIVGPTL